MVCKINGQTSVAERRITTNNYVDKRSPYIDEQFNFCL